MQTLELKIPGYEWVSLNFNQVGIIRINIESLLNLLAFYDTGTLHPLFSILTFFFDGLTGKADILIYTTMEVYSMINTTLWT